MGFLTVGSQDIQVSRHCGNILPERTEKLGKEFAGLRPLDVFNLQTLLKSHHMLLRVILTHLRLP